MNNYTELKIVLDLLKIGSIIIGPDNKIIYINEYLKKFLDIYNFENLGLKDLFEVYDGENIIDPSMIIGNPEIGTSGTTFEKEPLIITTKKGKSLIVSIKTQKDTRLREKNILGIVFIEDITEKNELEMMKIDFSSQAVHVLRTPLSIIRNNLNSLKNTKGYENLTEDEVKNLLEIEYGAEKLLNLAQDLITINEISNEKIELNLSNSNIVNAINTALKDLELVKNKTGNNVLVITPIYNLPEISIDTLKVVSVFKGIIMNSFKHTSFGEIRINISKDAKFVTVEIIDNGEGISESSLRFIFTKFYHSKKDPLAMEEGLGIGLFACKKVMEAHLGDINVESKKSIGTKVTLKFRI